MYVSFENKQCIQCNLLPIFFMKAFENQNGKLQGFL